MADAESCKVRPQESFTTSHAIHLAISSPSLDYRGNNICSVVACFPHFNGTMRRSQCRHCDGHLLHDISQPGRSCQRRRCILLPPGHKINSLANGRGLLRESSYKVVLRIWSRAHRGLAVRPWRCGLGASCGLSYLAGPVSPFFLI